MPSHKPKKKLSKKKKWLIASIAVVVLAIISVGLYFVLHHKTLPKKSTPAKVVKPLPPATVASRLSGVQVSPVLAQLPVTGVMIENSDGARPQSGLSQAGVIFEAVAEGGVTRFLALFEEGQPSSIGPVRSVRPYYIDWLLGFDAAIAHVGGSPDALAEIGPDNVKNLDQFANGSYYTRVSSRAAPHNVYTSMASLLALEKSKGYTSSNFKGFPRKADQPAKIPTVTKIDFNPSGPDFAAHYDYDPTLNSYKRSEAGSPMIDANTSLQLEPKVIIALIIPQSSGALDATGAYYTEYADIGSGQAYIFQDGGVVIGTWTKSSQTSQIQFTNSSGATINLDAGQTWLTALGSNASSYISYSK